MVCCAAALFDRLLMNVLKLHRSLLATSSVGDVYTRSSSALSTGTEYLRVLGSTVGTPYDFVHRIEERAPGTESSASQRWDRLRLIARASRHYFATRCALCAAHLQLTDKVAAFVGSWSLLVGVNPGAALPALLPTDLLRCSAASVKRIALVPIMPMPVSQSRLQHLWYCSASLSWI